MSSDEENLSSSSYNSEEDHDQEQDQGAEADQDADKEVEEVDDNGDDEEPTPSTITFESPIVTMEFHNASDKIACGLMDGVVALYEYGLDSNKELWNLSLHDKSLRDLKFNDAGTHLYTVSSDRALKVTDVETSKSFFEVDKAHKTAINCVGSADQFVFTGDDDGVVKVWDMRKKGTVFEWKENTEYISSFAYNHTKRILLAPSGDGTLAVFSYRKGKLEALSDNMEDELLNCVIVKNGKKAITGGQTGCLWIWSWGDWGDVTDRFTGHPDSVDKIIKYDDDTILTGSSDGLIRVVTIHPNKLLGVVGQHEDYPVDKLAMSHDRKFLASCPNESTLKFWGIEFLGELDEEDEEGEEDSDEEFSGEGSDQDNAVEGEENDGEDEEDAAEDDNEGNDDEEDEDDSEENNTNIKKPTKKNKVEEESVSDAPKKGVKRKKADEDEQDESVSEKPSNKKSKKEKLTNTPLGKFFADL